MKKPQVIFSTYDDISNPYYAGGGALAVHKIALGLSKKYHVKVVTSRHYISPTNNILDSVQYIRIGWTPQFLPQLGQFIFTLLLPFAALSLDFDIWIESFTPPFSVSLLPVFARKKVVGLAHLLGGREASEKYHFPFHILERFGLKAYKYCIAPSVSTADKLAKLAPHIKTTVIPNGVDMVLGGSRKMRNAVGYLGRIEMKDKGLSVLLDAFKATSHDHNWILYIAGNGVKSEINKLEKKITQLGLEKRVQLLGYLQGDKKEKFFSKIDIVVVPSLHETFCLSALEALSAGKALIWTDIPGLQWIPKNSGVRVPPSSEKALARALKTLINNSPKRATAMMAGKKFSRQYSWGKSVAQYESIIDTLI